ncbi:MAG: response regulator transcription factor [Gammaproteobacteria bacterium]
MTVSTVHPHHPRARGCSVCVVDDEPGVRELLSTLCESAGLAAEAYHSAESFLSAYRCEPIRARCLVLDFCLPGMSGLELLKELNAQGVRIPVLLMSGRADRATVVQGLKLGIVDFFPKPFEIEALLGRILELVGPNVPAKDRAGTPQRDHRAGFQPIFSDL